MMDFANDLDLDLPLPWDLSQDESRRLSDKDYYLPGAVVGPWAEKFTIKAQQEAETAHAAYWVAQAAYKAPGRVLPAEESTSEESGDLLESI